MRQITVVLFVVRSFREVNIDVYISVLINALKEIVPVFLALDHIKQGCWVFVLILGLKSFPLKMLSWYENFKNGKFVINIRGSTFVKKRMD